MAVITQRGEIFRGTETYNGPGTETISMSNGKTTCSSDPGGINVFHCSDGRTGIVTFTNCTDKGGCSSGRVRFSDGTEGDFIIGEAARRI